MADPREINLRLLSASTDGLPIVITGTTAAAPTLVHTSGSGTADIDLVYLYLCNTHASDLDVGVVVYTGTPADPTNVVFFGTIPAKSGRYVVLEGDPVTNSKLVGVYCATASKITASGKVGRATL
jgi:hypothetical protein